MLHNICCKKKISLYQQFQTFHNDCAHLREFNVSISLPHSTGTLLIEELYGEPNMTVKLGNAVSNLVLSAKKLVMYLWFLTVMNRKPLTKALE